MEYITVSETAKKWGISGRAVSYHLTGGRVPGAVKKGKLWLIPADAERPADHRRHGQPLPENALSFDADLSGLVAATTASLSGKDPDAILASLTETRLRRQYEAELAYFRGSFKRAMALFHMARGDPAARLRTGLIAVAAAVSAGDYHAYTEIENELRRYAQAYRGSPVAAFAELALAAAALGCMVPNLTPEWLRQGELSLIYPQVRPFALYLRAKYFQCTRDFSSMLAVAQTALALSAREDGFTLTDIYLRLCCAAACHALGREAEAERQLREAMALALPHGFITPFAENVTALGGLVEACLARDFPASRSAVLDQWARTFRNWTDFHNRFTREHLTLVLSRREYHIAQLAARRVPYARIAQQQGLSVGRVKNILLEIYEKLFISGRDELAKYVF